MLVYTQTLILNSVILKIITDLSRRIQKSSEVGKLYIVPQYQSYWVLLLVNNPLQQTEWKACVYAAVCVLVQVVSC